MRRGKRSSVRVLGWVGLALVMLGAVSVTAMALTASHGNVPPSKPLAVALHDAATAPPPTGVTARFAVHQHLIPGSSTLLSTGPLAGATGTVWAAGMARCACRFTRRWAPPSSRMTAGHVTFYNPKNHSAYRLALPSHERGKSLVDRACASVGGRHRQAAHRRREGRGAFGSDPGQHRRTPRLHGRGAAAPVCGPGRLAGAGLGRRTRRAAALRHHAARLETRPRSSWSSPTSGSANCRQAPPA